VCVCVLNVELTVQWNATLYTISHHHKTTASELQWHNNWQMQELLWPQCSQLLQRRKLPQLTVITVKFFITLVKRLSGHSKHTHIYWFIYVKCPVPFSVLSRTEISPQFSVKFCNIKSCESPLRVSVGAVCLQTRGPNGHRCTRMQTHLQWTLHSLDLRFGTEFRPPCFKRCVVHPAGRHGTRFDQSMRNKYSLVAVPANVDMKCSTL
jgi:hypothetical protein